MDRLLTFNVSISNGSREDFFTVKNNAGEIWTKSYGPHYVKFWAFDEKWLTIFDKVLTPFWKAFLWLKQLFDAELLI